MGSEDEKGHMLDDDFNGKGQNYLAGDAGDNGGKKGKKKSETDPPTTTDDTRNPNQDKKLTPSLIDLLKKAGWDHSNKGNGGGKRDLWYDPKSGEIYEKPKSGVGDGEPIGWNLKDVPGSGYSPSFSTPPINLPTPAQRWKQAGPTLVIIAVAAILYFGSKIINPSTSFAY